MIMIMKGFLRKCGKYWDIQIVLMMVKLIRKVSRKLINRRMGLYELFKIN